MEGNVVRRSKRKKRYVQLSGSIPGTCAGIFGSFSSSLRSIFDQEKPLVVALELMDLFAQ